MLEWVLSVLDVCIISFKRSPWQVELQWRKNHSSTPLALDHWKCILRTLNILYISIYNNKKKMAYILLCKCALHVIFLLVCLQDRKNCIANPTPHLKSWHDTWIFFINHTWVYVPLLSTDSYLRLGCHLHCGVKLLLIPVNEMIIIKWYFWVFHSIS